MEINLDFDGTCVTHAFPNIGKNIGAQKVLRMLVDKGHRLILFTMRGDKSENTNDLNIGMFLTDAVNWFKENNIPLYGIQTNPMQHTWTNSPKSYAPLMIDDSALGCPLKYDLELSPRPFVDWVEVERLLVEKGVL